MSYIYFSLEDRVKKFLFYLILILIFILLYCFLLEQNHHFLADYYYYDCGGRVLLFIPYAIYKICSFKKNRLQLKSNFTSKDWIIFFLMIFVRIFNIVCEIFSNKYPVFGKNISSIMIYFQNIFTIIFLSLFMKFVKDSNFYSHHRFSIILSFLFTIAFGIVKIKYNPSKAIYSNVNLQMIGVIILFFKVIFISLCATFEKYLMEQKKISFCLVGSLFGLLEVIFRKVYVLIYDINENINKKYILLIILMTIGFSIINYVIYRVIFEYNTIYSQILAFIVIRVDNIVKTFFQSKIGNFFSILIIIESFLALICLFIYVEIIELNFCGLNNNTRRNILKRLDKEQTGLDTLLQDISEEKDPNKDKVELPGGYIVNLKEEDDMDEINNNK